MYLALLKTLRPHQWVKNFFVAAPLVFSKNLFAGWQLGRAAIAVACFCLLSGAVYIINDIVDVEKDRAHPRKRHRPIAAGKLAVGVARIAAVVLAVIALGVGAWLSLAFAATAAGYLALNLLYSFWLKRVPFVDVVTIAVGFLLRVLAGTFAIHVDPSAWLLVCTALLACFLGFGKRSHELLTAGSGAERQRAVLAGYRQSHLDVTLWVLAVLTTISYVLYARAPHTVEFFGSHRMIFTTPFIAIGIWRFMHLVRFRPQAESPTEEMLRDKLFLANILAWMVAVVAVIYRAPR